MSRTPTPLSTPLVWQWLRKLRRSDSDLLVAILKGGNVFRDEVIRELLARGGRAKGVTCFIMDNHRKDQR